MSNVSSAEKTTTSGPRNRMLPNRFIHCRPNSPWTRTINGGLCHILLFFAIGSDEKAHEYQVEVWANYLARITKRSAAFCWGKEDSKVRQLAKVAKISAAEHEMVASAHPSSKGGSKRAATGTTAPVRRWNMSVCFVAPSGARHSRPCDQSSHCFYC